MGQTEFNLFILTANLLLLIFIGGIVVFVLQYRKRKMLFDKERAVIQEIHQKEILSTQLESQQQAMQYIGRDIHDNVGQKLTLAALYVQNLEYGGHYPDIRNELLTIGSVINESLTDLRQLSRSLAETGAANINLIKLIRNECERISASGTCTALLESDVTEVNTSAANKNVVYRIVQEFIQNSLKYAHCKKITVSIKTANGIDVQLTDDGAGFDLTKKRTGIGLKNIYQRAAMIGADLQINSSPGNGTSLHLFIPVDKI